MSDFLSKERITAGSGFNRWLVPPAALAVHLSIGMAYGFSVFWKPLGNVLKGDDGQPLAACALVQQLLATSWQARPKLCLRQTATGRRLILAGCTP